MEKESKMKEKSTNELLHSLKEADSFKRVYAETQPYLINQSVKIQLGILLEKTAKTKAAVIKAAAISEATGYQYFDGKRIPPRDKMIALILGFSLTLTQANELLKKTGFGMLYAKHERDAVFIYGISHQLSVYEVNDLLYEEGLETL